MSNTVTSLIRTYVPILVGALITWLATLHIAVTDDVRSALIVALTALITGAWYTLVRVLEKKWPQLGVLLGKAVQPVYAAPPVPDVPAVVVPVPVDPAPAAAVDKTPVIVVPTPPVVPPVQ